jgi:hypothetical protein
MKEFVELIYERLQVVSKFAATLDVPCEEQIARFGDLVSICKFSREDPQLDMILSAVKLEATSTHIVHLE